MTVPETSLPSLDCAGYFLYRQTLGGVMNDDTLHSVVSESNAGQPTKYKDEYAKQAYKLCLLGSTDEDMADFFEVSKSTINNWKHDYPEFLDSIKRGKVSADATVASRLYKRATGYEHDEDKIFNNQGEPLIVPTKKHVQPDTTAAIFWLKNRQPKMWRDKQEIEHGGSVHQEISNLTPEQVIERMKEKRNDY